MRHRFIFGAFLALLAASVAVPTLPAWAGPRGEEQTQAEAVALADASAERASAVSCPCAPVLATISGFTVMVGQVEDRSITATDADGQALTFSKLAGPVFMAVTTTDPGTGTAHGNIHVVPLAGDEGGYACTVQVSDGAMTDQKSFSLQITPANEAPVLQPVADMAVRAGTEADQEVHASDSGGEPLAFFMVDGPNYMSVLTTDPTPAAAVGLIRLTPGIDSQGGTAGARVMVTDGQLSSEQSFTVTLTPNVPPVLNPISDMNVPVGGLQTQTITATDADGDPLTFSKYAGPSAMTVTTVNPGTGTATGEIRVSPTAADAGSYTCGVHVTDGAFTAEGIFHLAIPSSHAPYLDSISPMSVRIGSWTEQYIQGHDVDGDMLSLGKAAGPPYMYVFESNRSSGYISGYVRLYYPDSSDVGMTTGTVRVSDGVLTGETSFSITVIGDSAPVLSQPADMTVTIGEIAQQVVTATDPDGDYVTITKSAGPSYVSVDYNYGYGFTTATIRATPGVGDVGTAMVTITAGGYGLTDSKSFSVTVLPGNFPEPCDAGAFSPVTTQFDYSLIELQTADFNRDGLPDLVAEMPEASRAAVALGLGDGSFGPLTDLDVDNHPVSGVVGDFNRDGFADAAVLDASSGKVWVSLGNGAGAFGAGKGFSIGTTDYSRSIAAADVNRDGKLDLLAGGYYGVRLLRGVGDGTFQAGTIAVSSVYAWAVIAEDLNRDGAPDLQIADPEQGRLVLFRNTGTGTFTGRTDYNFGYSSSLLGLASADLNADGKADVIVSNASANTLMVMLGNGDGSLLAAKSFPTGGGPRQVVAADLNGDGIPDLATVDIDSDDASILLGNGAGSFGPRTSVGVGYSPYGIVFADFNDDLRTDLATTSYYDGGATVLLNECAPRPDHPPVVHAPAGVSGAEGTVITVQVTATDPDGPAFTNLTANLISLPVGNNALFAVDPSFASGTFTWTPAYVDARVQPYPVTFTATDVLSASATTLITVLNMNRPPVANAGGPYTGLEGYPVAFDGTGSSDPDGDALTYSWVFGDGVTGVGGTPIHTYAASGVYGVALTVSDGAATSLATTTANVVGIFAARAFTSSGNRSIRLNAGKPRWCVDLEPIGRAYENALVNPSSIVMKSAGTGSVGEVFAISDKALAVGDHDGNGVEEITACFRKEDLRLLFSNLHGTSPVTVMIEGRLYTGGLFRAQLDVNVVAGGGQLASAVTPNPFNPEAVLTFRTERTGRARVDVYDLSGRLVRRLLDEGSLSPGYHDVRVDARDDHGAPLASGVYFFRIEAAEGTEEGRFTILK